LQPKPEVIKKIANRQRMVIFLNIFLFLAAFIITKIRQ